MSDIRTHRIHLASEPQFRRWISVLVPQFSQSVASIPEIARPLTVRVRHNDKYIRNIPMPEEHPTAPEEACGDEYSRRQGEGVGGPSPCRRARGIHAQYDGLRSGMLNPILSERGGLRFKLFGHRNRDRAEGAIQLIGQVIGGSSRIVVDVMTHDVLLSALCIVTRLSDVRLSK